MKIPYALDVPRMAGHSTGSNLSTEATSTLLLVSACDTGSANILAPVLEKITTKYSLYAQESAARVFSRWGIPYHFVEKITWSELYGIGEKLLLESGVETVITGTSWGPSIDKALVYAAKNLGVHCISIIEHWDLYMERFSVVMNLRITETGVFLPDRVWVNDSIARAEAVAAGIPDKIIDTIGQPHLEFQLQALMASGSQRKVEQIVFISERVAEDFAKDTPLYRGFDEFEVLEILLEIIDFTHSRLLIKLHPQEPIDKYDELLAGRANVSVVKYADNTEIISTAGILIGMFSMLLLEAALVRSDVISFMPGSDPSLFVGNRIGATRLVRFKREMKQILDQMQTEAGMQTHCPTAFGKRFVGSLSHMLGTIQELTK